MKQSNGRERNDYVTLLYLAIIILPMFLLGCYLYTEKLRIDLLQEFNNKQQEHFITSPQKIQRKEDKDTKKIDLVSLQVCDVFTGKWVLDNATHPLYKEDECDEFLPEWVACVRNGRPDTKYQKWRWQPRDCSLPRFDGKLLLEKLRGKKLIFVGDSMHYNQWQSMVCMVQSIIPLGKKTLGGTSKMSTFNIEEYNTTIAFYWTPFLVESSVDPPDKRDGKTDSIISPRSISKHGEYWKDADYLIFNSYLWWLRHETIKVLRKGSFSQEGSKEYEEIGIEIMYEQVLWTWSKWIEQNINPDRTSVFFKSMSPTHVRSSDWGDEGGGRCEKETEPILDMSRPLDVGTNKRLIEIAVNVTKSTKVVPIKFLNITTMSEYRKDGHITYYGSRNGRSDARSRADCYHWCLPGLPDTWNELLSLYVIYNKT